MSKAKTVSKRRPIAAQLAERLGGSWRAVRDGFGWMYRCDDGRTVRRYGEPVLGYDGYSDTEFNTVYYASPECVGRLGVNGWIHYSGPKFGDRQPMPSPSYL